MPRVGIGPALPDRDTLDVEIAHLRDLDVNELRGRWQAAFGRPTPTHLPRHLVFRMVAYQLQAERFGDLDAQSRRLLDHSETSEKAGRSAASVRRLISELRPGTTLGREWNGQMQRVSSSPTALPGMAKPTAASHMSLPRLPARAGMGRDSSGCATDPPKERQYEARSSEACTLRDLYPSVDRSGIRAEFQFSRRAACQAYIRSQAHAGWTLVRVKYDDGGFSGGNTERPALQRLLEDVRAGRVQVIVVYKVDRLTRSLADFAKLVELFDAHNASFVSVTQQFNTTTSMGRLTLNVLLSFAQFEREVTSERIRDKIAASKRKGLWVGGKVPLGYAVKDKQIVVVEEGAALVRSIFQLYLELGSVNLLMKELRKRDVRTKVQKLRSGRTIGGISFTRGPLSYLLRNRFFLGEVVYKGEALPGPQPPILDPALFDAVQAKLADQDNNHIRTRLRSEALLVGKIYDDRGHRMSPSHSRKKGVRYRYYISLPLLDGRPEDAGSISRVPAAEIEHVVAHAVRQELGIDPEPAPHDLIEDHVTRVEIRTAQISVELRVAGAEPRAIQIPWQKPPPKRRRELLVPASGNRQDPRPIRADARARLIAALSRGRRWLDEMLSGSAKSVEEIANREGCSPRKVNLTLSLAFLAPEIVKAAIDGRLPRGVGISRLSDLPASWREQFRQLRVVAPAAD
jgi:site-specific DNA recombinase